MFHSWSGNRIHWWAGTVTRASSGGLEMSTFCVMIKIQRRVFIMQHCWSKFFTRKQLSLLNPTNASHLLQHSSTVASFQNFLVRTGSGICSLPFYMCLRRGKAESAQILPTTCAQHSFTCVKEYQQFWRLYVYTWLIYTLW